MSLYRLKDFLTKNVLYSDGKKAGIVSDVIVNFNEKKVQGFSVSGGSILRRKNKVVYIENIIYYDCSIIIGKMSEKKLLTFSAVKGMEVTDIKGNIIGIAEDILFDNKFKLRGIIISPGMIRKLVIGKGILLINELIFGDKNILYFGKGNFRYTSLRHEISGADYYE
ncbi:PRC-barrel domain-containing protein [Clostridium thermarum]|uniref:PRC-barrel domain-containing protein n=1 Tax=Clostridium thermarum TaxID=1716543 RepID=UPI0013D7DB22|nr:PRC-barrel domain-containing protein [Clostridium thermarum]